MGLVCSSDLLLFCFRFKVWGNRWYFDIYTYETKKGMDEREKQWDEREESGSGCKEREREREREREVWERNKKWVMKVNIVGD